MKNNPELARALKADPDLAESWDNLREVGLTDDDFNVNPDVLKEFIKVPSLKRGKFPEWFDALSYEQAAQLWKNETIAKNIAKNLRNEGGEHEWYMVGRAPDFKKWDVSVQEIFDFTTRTDELVWTVPDDVGTVAIRGQDGGHGGVGSGTFHNEMRDIVDSANSLADFNQKLAVLLERWDIPRDLLPSLR